MHNMQYPLISEYVKAIQEAADNLDKLAYSFLNSVVIPDGVTSIGKYAFRHCSSLSSLVIPDSVTSIECYAFSGCESLSSIVIPDSVTSIGYHAFASCNLPN